jgi:hypothetical protein
VAQDEKLPWLKRYINGDSSQVVGERSDNAIAAYLKRIPAQSRLDYYELDQSEKAFCRAMCSVCPEKRDRSGTLIEAGGRWVFASLATLSCRAGISRKTAQRIVRGRKDKKHGRMGLLERGIITELASATPGECKGATFRLNWEALTIAPWRRRELEAKIQRTPRGLTLVSNQKGLPDLNENLSSASDHRSTGIRPGGPEGTDNGSKGYGPQVPGGPGPWVHRL